MKKYQHQKPKTKLEEPVLKLEEESEINEEPLILEEVHAKVVNKKTQIKSEAKISRAARRNGKHGCQYNRRNW